MFHYNITTRQFFNNDILLAKPVGKMPPYSGTRAGRNNLGMVNVPNIGPIPPGLYRIERSRNSKTLGPVVFDLTPMPGTNTFGRTLFRIHGNSADNDASHGCLILNRDTRDAIAKIVDVFNYENDNDNVLEVLAA